MIRPRGSAVVGRVQPVAAHSTMPSGGGPDCVGSGAVPGRFGPNMARRDQIGRARAVLARPHGHVGELGLSHSVPRLGRVRVVAPRRRMGRGNGFEQHAVRSVFVVLRARTVAVAVIAMVTVPTPSVIPRIAGFSMLSMLSAVAIAIVPGGLVLAVSISWRRAVSAVIRR